MLRNKICVVTGASSNIGRSVAIELSKTAQHIYLIGRNVNALEETSGVVIQDDNQSFNYPMPLTSQGKNEVFVGRIRKDNTIENGLNMWIVADNLRKGAATNAVQIADYLINNEIV